MRKALSISLVLAVALAGSAFAKPATTQQMNIERLDSPSELHGGSSLGVFGTSIAGTVYFGGTYWNSDSSRWEAIEDSVWTFDSGVGTIFDATLVDSSITSLSAMGLDPFKDYTVRHAVMEGWYGYDLLIGGTDPYWRVIDETDVRWDSVCVGDHHGLQGDKSMWSGVFDDEATDLCWVAGQGYGNNWNVNMRKEIVGVGGVGDGQLNFDYSIETEGCCDFVEIFIDPTGSGAGSDREQLSQGDGGHLSGAAKGVAASIDLEVVNNHWPAANGNVFIYFSVQSDGGWSDEDAAGGFVTECGAFSIDNIDVKDNGVTVHSTDFESGATDGWDIAPVLPGFGDYSDIQTVASLGGFIGTECDCDLQNNVVTFEDSGFKPDDIQNLVGSPWIDLLKANAVAPGKVIEYDIYGNLPLRNGVLLYFQAAWYPAVCTLTGKLEHSGWRDNNTVYYLGDATICSDPVGNNFTRDYSTLIDPGAEQLKIALGVINFCPTIAPGWADCANFGGGNNSPWFDNVRLGVYGDEDQPTISVRAWHVPQDAFAQDGTLRIDSPGRFDVGDVLAPDNKPAPNTATGDTLVVTGGGTGDGSTFGVEVLVQFALCQLGPGADTTGSNFLTPFTPENVWYGQQWYSAEMDTAEAGGANVGPDTWMGTFIEGSAGFSGADTDKDSGDIDPLGNMSRLANDMFPDDLFTPGTRINLFYKARYVDLGTGLPLTSEVFIFPDTSNGGGYEWECLPSSMDASDTSWNCVLYVDHFNAGAQAPIETGLATILTGGSANYDNQQWDRWDVQAASSGQVSWGRPTNSQYGCRVTQAFGYKAIIWNTGNGNSFKLREEDAANLVPWLNLTTGGLGNNRLYVNGNGVATAVNDEQAEIPTALTLMNGFCGVDWNCSTVRETACNGQATKEDTYCLPVDPLGGDFAGSSGASVVGLAGNGCPEIRDYDRIDNLSGVANEQYTSPKNGNAAVNYASVSKDVSGGPDYRTVWDAASVHYRYDVATCLDTQTYVTDRLQRVMTWFGYGVGGDPANCVDPLKDVDVPGTGFDNSFVTSLKAARPNPFQGNGSVTIAFSTKARGLAKVEVFDVNGRLVRTVENTVLEAGDHQIEWDGNDNRGKTVASGVYFYRLSSQGEKFAKKLVVIRNGN